MTDPNAFWWDWWVNVAVAVGTLLTVIVAVFGQAFRVKFFPPLMGLDLVTPMGEETREVAAWGTIRAARYYRLRAENRRRWAPANTVQITLLRVEVPGPDAELQVQWTGNVPFTWMHPQLFPSGRAVGPPAVADFCSVSHGAQGETQAAEQIGTRLRLHLALFPNNLPAHYTGATTIVVTVQVQGAEADSAPVRFRIAWDGQWHVGETEMRRHLVVDRLNAG